MGLGAHEGAGRASETGIHVERDEVIRWYALWSIYPS
jgi:hypothetical protein